MGLREDIHANPACAVALAAKDCAELARIMSIGRTRLVAINKDIFAIWCASTGMRAVIEDHCINVQSPLRSIALTLRDFLVGPPGAVINFNNAGNLQSLAAWQAVGAITPAQADTLIALGIVDHPYTRLEIADAVFNIDGTEK